KTADVTKMTVVGIYKLVTLQLNLKAMGGPIMIVTVAAGLAGIGWVEVALFVALISISLGIINLCPFLPTDGWHILMAVLEKIRGRRLAPQTQERVMMAGVYFVLTLFVVVLYNDMMRFGWIERMQEWVIRSF
ncbi:MAG TPA: site-2 protease family protein, partial [bacterium]|nr:site-2 protease family protein [bacterium]